MGAWGFVSPRFENILGIKVRADAFRLPFTTKHLHFTSWCENSSGIFARCLILSTLDRLDPKIPYWRRNSIEIRVSHWLWNARESWKSRTKRWDTLALFSLILQSVINWSTNWFITLTILFIPSSSSMLVAKFWLCPQWVLGSYMHKK